MMSFFVGQWYNSIEKSNLSILTKLVVRELLEHAMKHSRTMEFNEVPLIHFFVVIESILKHGFRRKYPEVN